MGAMIVIAIASDKKARHPGRTTGREQSRPDSSGAALRRREHRRGCCHAGGLGQALFLMCFKCYDSARASSHKCRLHRSRRAQESGGAPRALC